MYAIKTWLRRPLAMLLWLLVLTTACTLLCTGVFTYISTRKTTDVIESQFSTIAIMNERKVEFIFNEDGTIAGVTGLVRPKGDSFADNENVLLSDFRRYQSAYSEGITSLLSAMTEKAYSSRFDVPYGAVMFRGTMLSHTYDKLYAEASPELGLGEAYYNRLQAIIEVDETILIHPGYELPETIQITWSSPDPLPDVSDGEGYILFGRYDASHLIWDVSHDIAIAAGEEPEIFDPLFVIYDNVPEKHTVYYSDGTSDILGDSEFDDVRMPTLAFISGETEDFLTAPENELWARTMERYKITFSSMPLLGTDCIESMLLFNQKKAELVEGRFFTDEEYQNGELVCVISDMLAEQNGLNVGDKLNLRAYYIEAGTPSGDHTFTGFSDHTPQPMVYNPTTGFEGEARDYEIIGLYHMENAWTNNDFSFNPNTVFVPNSTIQGEYYTSDEGVMYSLRLKNGYGDAFMSSIVGTEFEEAFTVFDQGYSQMQKTIEQLNSNALILVSLGGAAFVAVALLYVLLNIGGQKHIYGTMRSLGQTEENVAKFATGSSLLPLIVVLPLSCIVTYALLGVVKEKLLLGYDANIVWVIPIVAVVEGLLLAAFVGGYCRKIMKANPLALMKEVK